MDAGHSSGQSPQTHQEVASEDHALRTPADELPNYEETVYWVPEELEEETEVKKISNTPGQGAERLFLNSYEQRQAQRRKVETTSA